MVKIKTTFFYSFIILTNLLTACEPGEDQTNSKGKINHFVHREGKNIVTADGQPILLRGMNLGNWLLPEGYMWKLKVNTAEWQIKQMIKELVGPAEARNFWKQYYDTYITEQDIQFIKKIGLNSIRLPFNFRILSPEDYPEIWLNSGFDLLDWVIKWSKKAGLYVILDMHSAPGGQTGTNIDDSYGHPWLFESEESISRLIQIWTKIAERYKNETTIIGYDLLNEPIPHFEEYQKYNNQLEPIYKRIVSAIREVDKNHMIFLGGARWNTNFQVFGTPFDSNVVYTFHKYWMDPVQEQIQEYVDFREKYNVPIWMGESGENKDEWIAQYRELLERNNIGWCFWPYKKMDAESCIRTFKRPQNWDEIIKYAQSPRVEVVKIKEFRPTFERGRTALQGFLENIRFEKTKINQGYVKALGMTPPVEGKRTGQ